MKESLWTWFKCKFIYQTHFFKIDVLSVNRNRKQKIYKCSVIFIEDWEKIKYPYPKLRTHTVVALGCWWPRYSSIRSMARNPCSPWVCTVASAVSDFATPWTVACQAPLAVGFPRQEYWSWLPCPPPGDLPDPGILEPASHVFHIGRQILHH